MSHQSLATHTNELSPGRSLPSERKTLTEHLKSIKLASEPLYTPFAPDRRRACRLIMKLAMPPRLTCTRLTIIPDADRARTQAAVIKARSRLR